LPSQTMVPHQRLSESETVHLARQIHFMDETYYINISIRT